VKLVSRCRSLNGERLLGDAQKDPLRWGPQERKGRGALQGRVKSASGNDKRTGRNSVRFKGLLVEKRLRMDINKNEDETIANFEYGAVAFTPCGGVTKGPIPLCILTPRDLTAPIRDGREKKGV